MGIILDQLGCEVRLPHGGREAIEDAPAFEPELVSLDLNMPGMEGYQTAIELRKQAWSAKAAFGGRAASTDPSVAEIVRKIGFSYFVPKPASAYSFESIITALRKVKRLG